MLGLRFPSFSVIFFVATVQCGHHQQIRIPSCTSTLQLFSPSPPLLRVTPITFFFFFSARALLCVFSHGHAPFFNFPPSSSSFFALCHFKFGGSFHLVVFLPCPFPLFCQAVILAPPVFVPPAFCKAFHRNLSFSPFIFAKRPTRTPPVHHSPQFIRNTPLLQPFFLGFFFSRLSPFLSRFCSFTWICLRHHTPILVCLL